MKSAQAAFSPPMQACSRNGPTAEIIHSEPNAQCRTVSCALREVMVQASAATAVEHTGLPCVAVGQLL
jgi:hypothetical protein